MKTHPSASAPEDRAMDGYEQDFYAWTQRTAALLRAGRFDEADIAHVAEEIEDMGRRDLRELNGRVQVLMAHLLKWQVQPEGRGTSWPATIATQRLELDSLLEQSPSLRPKLVDGLAVNYERAVKRAMAEAGLGRERFPASCPYGVDDVLDEDFLPH